MDDLWACSDPSPWDAALARYQDIIVAQGSVRLVKVDRWYCEELANLLAARHPAFVTREELIAITEWKMMRGIWRGRNLALVRSNDAETVEATSRDAFAKIPDPLSPIKLLATLSGVGPATASAVLSAAAPETYPFFDEDVATQIRDFGTVEFSVRAYARYAAALRERAILLGGRWTPTLVERALWVHSGGKSSRSPKG